MSDKNQDLGSGWDDLKGLIETLEVDVQKSLQVSRRSNTKRAKAT
jgi:hypothetical protein